ncbi:MAG: hypothetical protein JWN70_5924 [Planctomycetaceae bacterium]|nr:hypothetical protein [Planctomycetaceae bacterium]
MKRHLLQSIAVACALCSFLCIAAWTTSYRLQVSVNWASDSTHYQIVSCRGTVYVVLNRNWWRKEPLVIYYDTNPGTSSITQWPGMRIKNDSACLGFERATGEWVSPFMRVSNDAALAATHRHLKPGTMHYTITPIEIIGIPYWAISLMAIAIFVGAVRARPKRHSQSHADCQTALRQPLPTIS